MGGLDVDPAPFLNAMAARVVAIAFSASSNCLATRHDIFHEDLVPSFPSSCALHARVAFGHVLPFFALVATPFQSAPRIGLACWQQTACLVFGACPFYFSALARGSLLPPRMPLAISAWFLGNLPPPPCRRYLFPQWASMLVLWSMSRGQFSINRPPSPSSSFSLLACLLWFWFSSRQVKVVVVAF